MKSITQRIHSLERSGNIQQMEDLIIIIIIKVYNPRGRKSSRREENQAQAEKERLLQKKLVCFGEQKIVVIPAEENS